MSRRALWPVGTDPAVADGAGQSPTDDPGNSRAVSRHVEAGAGAPGIATSADIRAQCATGRDVSDVLARIASLHEQLAQAHRDLSEKLQNQLAVPHERALMSSVEPTRLLTAEDLAARLQVDSRTIRRWRKAGRIPTGIEVAGVVRWRAEEIERWLESGGEA